MNWDIKTKEEIKKIYESEKTSFKKLEQRFGVHYKKIQRIAKEEGWKKFTGLVKNDNLIKPEVKAIINQVGKRKIEELVKELGDHYTPADEPLIVIYALNYQRYLKLEGIVAIEGETVVSLKTGASYLNPNFIALQSVTSNLAKIGDKLGLSIASRTRLNISFKKEEKTKSLFDLVENLEEQDNSFMDDLK